MIGSLIYWFNGLPVNIIDDNLELRYWFCGLPFSYSEPVTVTESDEQRFYFFI